MRLTDLKDILNGYQKIEMFYVKEDEAQYYLGLAMSLPIELDDLNVEYICAGQGDCPKYEGQDNILLIDAYDDEALKKIKQVTEVYN
jgi:hypothetical protein